MPNILHHRGKRHPLTVILRVSISITRFPGLPVACPHRGMVQQPAGDADWRAGQSSQRQQGAVGPVCSAGLDNPSGL
jgi:hypothetical protein